MNRNNEALRVAAPVLSAEEIRDRLAYLALTESDAAMLRELGRVVEPRLDEIADRFYQHLLAFEKTRRVFKDEAMVARLKEAQKAYLMQALRGPYNAAYFEQRWRIGYIHHAIGLDPEWFIGGFHLYRSILYPIIVESWADDIRSAMRYGLALDKVLTLDMNVGLESYWAHYHAATEVLSALNERLEAASAAKSQFLANMSHEFRTPLNAIIGFTEVLQDQIPGPLNGDQLEYLGDVHNAGQLLLRLINDVLDLAKVEAGRLELFYESFPIAQTVREAVTALRGAAEKKGLGIQLNLPPDLGLITADQIRLKQILFNLLSNAMKFTDRGGVTVTATIEDGQLHLTIADTGIGIRPEDMQRIFVEFSQVNNSHARRYEGTGLGLALSKRLVEAHGGRIWLESTFGTGSVFHVLLPLQPPNDKNNSPNTVTQGS